MSEKLTEVLHIRVTARTWDRIWKVAHERRTDVSELLRDVLDRAELPGVAHQVAQAAPVNGGAGNGAKPGASASRTPLPHSASSTKLDRVSAAVVK
jgi:hypothetical protein